MKMAKVFIKQIYSLMPTLWIGLVLSFMVSCAHVQSGRYVQLTAHDDIGTIAKRFKLPQWELAMANPNKSFLPGEWIFVPGRGGILGKNKRSIASLPKSIGKQFLWPIPSSKRVSSHFGKRWGKRHHGIDIPARKGTAILAVDDGVVVYSGQGLSGYGNLTVLAHRYGLFSVYAHAKENLTRKGQKVHRGQVIAKVGTSGRSSGPHLHFEVRYQGQSIDPMQLIRL